ncbi:MAG: hypothetical protein ACYDEQ_10900 [Desulfocucumaceae bacterium]
MDKLFNKIDFVPNENIVTQLGNLILTNKRVAYEINSGTQHEIRVALVEDIDSVNLVSNKPNALLILVAIILFIVSLFTFRIDTIGTILGITLIAISIVCAIMYFLKKQSLVLTLNGDSWVSIRVNQIAKGNTSIVDFVNKFFATKCSS